MQTITEGDNSKMLVVLRGGDRQAADLTGSTVSFRWRIGAGARVTRGVVVIDRPGGIVTFRFADGDLTPGILVGDVFYDDADGNRHTIDMPIYFRIRKAS